MEPCFPDPPPAVPNAHAASTLGGSVDGPFDYDDGSPVRWSNVDEPEILMGEEIVAPELAGWHHKRMPRCPDTAWATLTPGRACEACASPTLSVDLLKKRPLCAREVVGKLWLAEPTDRTPAALGRGVVADRARKGQRSTRHPPLETTEFGLDDLWR